MTWYLVKHKDNVTFYLYQNAIKIGFFPIAVRGCHRYKYSKRWWRVNTL